MKLRTSQPGLSRAIAAITCVISIATAAETPSRPAGKAILIEYQAESAYTRIANLAKDPQLSGVSTISRGSASAITAPPVLVLMTDGNRIAGSRIRLIAVADTLEVTLLQNSEEKCSLPLEHIRGIVMANESSHQAQFIRLLESPGFTDDVVILNGGDRFSGEILQIADDQLRIKSAAGEVEVAIPRIVAIAFSRELWETPEEVCRVAAMTTYGEVLTSPTAEVVKNILQLTKQEQVIDVPLSTVRSLSLYGDDVRRLSALPVVESEYRPYLPEILPPADPKTVEKGDGSPIRDFLQVDRSVQGELLTVDGQVFAKGLGVWSGVQLSYDIPQDAVRFQALVGIDDAGKDHGSVVFKILLDGRQAWSSEVIRGRDSAVEVRIDLKGARRLTLVAEYGPDGDIQDLADWCEPIFLLEREMLPSK